MSGDLDLRSLIRALPDFPQPGITYRDITPLLASSAAVHQTVHELVDWARPYQPEYVAAPEARGFILGGALAYALGAGFIPIRKPGKLPDETFSAEYVLEYGVDALEIHADALAKGARVLLHDDLLATGGTAGALAQLVTARGAEVLGCTFLVELDYLQGRKRLEGFKTHSLIHFEQE